MRLITDPEAIDREYANIEDTFARMKDLLRVPTKDNGEKLVSIDPRSGIISGYRKVIDMAEVLGGIIYIREGAYDRLLAANRDLRGIDPDLTFDVQYGYRTNEIQCHYFFNEALPEVRAYVSANNLSWTEAEIFERASWYAAFPEVAGHPTGGAIDLTLRNKKLDTELDMGTPIFGNGAMDRKIYYASPEISATARENRSMLRTAMESAGFHGFEGEFWHHSYGDREWAYKKGIETTLYAPIELNQATAMLALKP